MTFEQAVDAVLKEEAGYANDPADKGGETICGITRKNYPSWPGWVLVDAAQPHPNELLNSPEFVGLVRDYYKVEWWDRYGLQLVDARIRGKLFSFAVNMGWPAANKLYMTSKDAPDPLMALIHQACLRYARICQKDPTQVKWLAGWINRAFG